MPADRSGCGAKHSQYNFIIDSFNHKKLTRNEHDEIIKYIARTYRGKDHSFTEYLEDSYWKHGQSLVFIIFGKYENFNVALHLAQSIRDKFYCDVTLTMTDDDDCNEYQFFKGAVASKPALKKSSYNKEA